MFFMIFPGKSCKDFRIMENCLIHSLFANLPMILKFLSGSTYNILISLTKFIISWGKTCPIQFEKVKGTLPLLLRLDHQSNVSALFATI